MTLESQQSEFWNSQTTASDRYSADAEFLRRYVAEVQSLYGDRQPTSVLDVGCGSGTMYRPFGFDRLRYKGIDYSGSMLESFRSEVQGIDVEQADAGSFVSPETFDLIIAINVVQYFSPAVLQQHLQNAAKMLTENGVIVIAGAPDIRQQRGFDSGVLGPARSKKPLLRRYRSYIKRAIPERLKAILGLKWDGIGHWYSEEQFNRFAAAAGLDCKTARSVEYPYRFHAVMCRKP